MVVRVMRDVRENDQGAKKENAWKMLDGSLIRNRLALRRLIWATAGPLAESHATRDIQGLHRTA